MFLMETKQTDEMVEKKLTWLHDQTHFSVPPHSPGGGGLFLSWKNNIDLSVLSSSHNFIETEITTKGITFHAIFVYGEPDHTKRNTRWDKLSNLKPSSGEPWFLTGDFNELVNNYEKNGGPERAEGTFGSFRMFLSQNYLFDLKHT